MSCATCGRDSRSQMCRFCATFFEDVLGEGWKEVVGVRERKPVVVRYSITIDGETTAVDVVDVKEKKDG